jgi:hypothetical protein
MLRLNRPCASCSFLSYDAFPSPGDISLVLLLLRKPSDDLGFLMIDPAETELAIGPIRTNWKQTAINSNHH